MDPNSGLSIPIPGIEKDFKIMPTIYPSDCTWHPGPNGMSKEKKEAAQARKKLLKKLRKRGKQHS